MPLSEQDGVIASTSKNEKYYPGWTNLAVEAIRKYAETSRVPFRAEDVRRANPEFALITASIYGWGQPFKIAAELRYIVHAQTASSDGTSCHQKHLQCWISPEFAQTEKDRLIADLKAIPKHLREEIFWEVGMELLS